MAKDHLPSSKRVRGGRAVRSAKPAALAAKTAARWAGTYLARGERRQEKRDQFVLKTAEDVTRTMGEMKGAVMKLGQIMSLMTGMVPPEMADQLATLQANAPPMSYDLVRGVIREEFGKEPDALFRRFAREPFASASIGQVHRAELPSGEQVAVKVQYPGVREAITADMSNAGMLLGLAGIFSKGLDAGPIVRDLQEGIIGELDYVKEASSQERFGRLYAGHAFIRVPAVHREFSSGRVLTQEYLEGERFSVARDWDQKRRDQLAEVIFRFTFGNFYRHQLFNGDPHPGNYVLMKDGSVGFLDYGCVAEYSLDLSTKLRNVLKQLYAKDLEGWRAACVELGILSGQAPYSTAELYDHMHWFWKPVLQDRVTFTNELAAEIIRRNAATTGEAGQINRWLNIPPGTVFLSRINFGLAGLMASLNASGPWRGIIAEYLYDEPPCTDLGRRSAATSVGPAV